MADVIGMPGVTYGNVPPDKVLKAAIDKLDEVIIIGIPKDRTDVNYFAASTADGKTVLWLLESCKLALFKADQIRSEEYE